eukprot:13148111-Ditylum_brightwellii.AAC.1
MASKMYQELWDKKLKLLIIPRKYDSKNTKLVQSRTRFPSPQPTSVPTDNGLLEVSKRNTTKTLDTNTSCISTEVR